MTNAVVKLLNKSLSGLREFDSSTLEEERDLMPVSAEKPQMYSLAHLPSAPPGREEPEPRRKRVGQ